MLIVYKLQLPNKFKGKKENEDRIRKIKEKMRIGQRWNVFITSSGKNK